MFNAEAIRTVNCASRVCNRLESSKKKTNKPGCSCREFGDGSKRFRARQSVTGLKNKRKK